MRIPIHHHGDIAYHIVLKENFTDIIEEFESLQLNGRNICIVTDTNVSKLYLKEVKEILLPYAKKVLEFEFRAGEENKTLDTVRFIYERLVLEHFDRKDILIALGGGVVGDICGFAAATYLRGIRFIQIPTTLLAQVDSSIGGKTGVDFDTYKNMVGAFHMPSLVYINIHTLKTLPKKEFSSGMAEVIKHGLIQSQSYYHWLKEYQKEILGLNPKICIQMIKESIEIKKGVVESDPYETKGERAILNFGHTLGHAIEKEKKFKLTHGSSVALGMLSAFYIMEYRKKISLREIENLKELLQYFGLSTSIDDIDISHVVEYTKNDKKMDGDKIQFILLEDLGKAYIDKTVTREDMKEALIKLRE